MLQDVFGKRQKKILPIWYEDLSPVFRLALRFELEVISSGGGVT